MTLIVKQDEGRNEVRIDCPFNIGDIVRIDNYGCVYFDWFILNSPRLHKLCPIQYGGGHSESYADPSILPQQWMVKDIVPRLKNGELCVLLSSITRETLFIQVRTISVIDSFYFKPLVPNLPFTVVDRRRKTKKYLEVEDWQ